MWYKVDFRKLGASILPTDWRSSSVIALVNTLTAPLQQIVDEFNANRIYNLERASVNGQVCHLRGILNDKYDFDRRITIEDPISKSETYIYTDAENKPKYLGELALYPESEFSGKNVDFIVKVPNILKDYHEQIYATVDYYRLASKRFRIEYEDI
ncbi:hypothetical protein [Elizabethkingia miricola]|uniref:hypothetical protein n=1 Tax=Elizabethkingia miricola TaxID=172045 RepID=UPI0038922714